LSLELTPALFTKAMLAARKHGLRAYDAVQLTVALELNRLNQDDGFGPVTLISADLELNAAATTEGLTALDPNTHP
jgi:predicted nucleic acid-binding protein